ncbi:MAG: DUF1697 domain-containing protein [Albidovulum sp.]
MAAPGETWVAFYRAIGGGTHAKMPMAALRRAAEAAGLAEVRTVLATGNLLFQSDAGEAELRTLLDGIAAEHGLGAAQKVFLRRAVQLPEVLAACPFPEAARERPNHVLVQFLEREAPASAIEALAAWGGPERCAARGREVYLDYPLQIAGSKLTPAKLERMIGAPGTARNWNTLTRIVAAG